MTPRSAPQPPVRELVLASAGTGKTYTLSGRYLALIARGVTPESILATTFTRKAAGEIAARILGRLAAAASDGTARERLNEQLGLDAPLTAGDCTRLAAGLARRLHTMRVMTLDAYFGPLASAATLELDLPADPVLLDEPSLQSLQIEAIDRALDTTARDNKTDAEHDASVIELLRMLQNAGASRRVRDAIAGNITDAHDLYLRTGGASERWGITLDPGHTLDDTALTRAVEAVRAMTLPTKRDGTPNGHWLGAHKRLLQHLEDKNWKAIAESGLTSKILCDEVSFQKQAIEPHHVECLEPIARHAAARVLTAYQQQNTATLALLRRYHDALVALKRAEASITYDDIPRALLSMPDDARQALLFDADARADHVLLDEFQDTSVEQYELLQPLLEEIISDESDARRLFIVGDPKQSLYMWRRAEPELVASMHARYSPRLHRSDLAQSWRSSQTVLDAVDDVFGRVRENPVMNEHAEPTASRFAELWTCPTAAIPREGEFVLRTAMEPDEADETGSAAARVHTAIQTAVDLHERAPWASVGILLRTSRRIPAIVAGIRSVLNDEEAVVSEEGGASPADSPATAAALSALRFAHHPGSTLNHYHAATSVLAPALELEDPLDRAPERASARLRQRIDRLTPAGFLDDLYAGVFDRLTARERDRFAQLVDLAHRLQSAGRTDNLADLAHRLETSRIATDTAAPIRVMTIHAAKGLEFDAVVLPELDDKWNSALSRSSAIAAPADDPLAPPDRVVRYACKELRALHAQLASVHDAAFQRYALGELCALYVAMTRAKHHLEVIINPVKDPDKHPCSTASLLRAAFAPDGGCDHDDILFHSVSGHDWAEVHAPTEAAPTQQRAEISIGLAQPDAASTPAWSLRRRSASSPDDASRRVPLATFFAGTPAADLGTAVHAAFESIDWLDSDRSPSLEELLAQVDASLHDRARPVIERALASRAIVAALSPARYAERAGDTLDVRNELPFAYRVPATDDRAASVLTGRIDRLVIGRDRSGGARWADILDFKVESNTGATSTTLEEVAETYRAQIEAYRAAVAVTFGLDAAVISAALVLVTRGEVLEL